MLSSEVNRILVDFKNITVANPTRWSNVNFIIDFLLGKNCQGCDKKIIDKILKYK